MAASVACWLVLRQKERLWLLITLTSSNRNSNERAKLLCRSCTDVKYCCKEAWGPPG